MKTWSNSLLRTDMIFIALLPVRFLLWYIPPNRGRKRTAATHSDCIISILTNVTTLVVRTIENTQVRFGKTKRRIGYLRIMLSIAYIIALYSVLFNVKIIACSWFNFISGIRLLLYYYGDISFVPHIYPLVCLWGVLVKISNPCFIQRGFKFYCMIVLNI